ncbi:hypothetical protein LRS10_21295 [Phenylobacterium sp. J426]|uniref:hypothetical protein n=1 Tax=Phenylobacterium sp. J426 TaxID=2898439 RepID=UPI002151BD5F|nr:hypothetical protein [Phenylobacterium sp. J426]MCR5876456.1 hypothetical protein [Phenylobacterium sp. J426]
MLKMTSLRPEALRLQTHGFPGPPWSGRRSAGAFTPCSKLPGDKPDGLRVELRLLATFRHYMLSVQGQIEFGDWIEAPDLVEAQRQAVGRCGGRFPRCEIWQGAERLAEFTCGPEQQPLPSPGPDAH